MLFISPHQCLSAHNRNPQLPLRKILQRGYGNAGNSRKMFNWLLSNDAYVWFERLIMMPSVRNFRRCRHKPGWPGLFCYVEVVWNITDQSEPRYHHVPWAVPEQYIVFWWMRCEKTSSFGIKLLSAKALKVDDVSRVVWGTCLTSQNSSSSSSESPNDLPKLKRHNCSTNFLVINIIVLRPLRNGVIAFS